MNRWSKALVIVAVLSSVVLATAWTVHKVEEPPRPAALTNKSVRAVPSPYLETSYVAITPCRVVDTRVNGGALGDGVAREYYVAGTFGFSPQGGKSGGCGIPTSAKAVSTTVTAVGAAGEGYVRSYPAGSSEPTATLLNYSKVNTGTSGNLPIRSGSGKHLALKNHLSSTHLVVDVTGYFIPQMDAYILSSGTISDNSGRLLSSTKTGTGTYSLQWDRDVTACSVNVNPDFSAKFATAYTSGTYTYVYTFTDAGVPVDYWFNINVNC